MSRPWLVVAIGAGTVLLGAAIVHSWSSGAIVLISAAASAAIANRPRGRK